MGYLDLYREELDNEETQYFIFDTSLSSSSLYKSR